MALLIPGGSGGGFMRQAPRGPSKAPPSGGATVWAKPPEVTAANEDWKAENDQLGRFIEDCCDSLPSSRQCGKTPPPVEI
jgi:hypothetical protein